MGKRKEPIKLQQNYRTSVLATLSILTALAFVLSSGALSLSRYMAEHRTDQTAVASSFYFTSDVLSEDCSYTQLERPEEGDTVRLQFTLYNYIDELRTSQTKFRYTCNLYRGETLLGYSPLSGEFGTEKAEVTQSWDVKLSDFEAGPLKVVAKVSSPYQKTISGEFGMETAGASAQRYVVYEENGAVVLELLGACDSYASVTWPETLIADQGCKYLSSVASTKTVTTVSYAGSDRVALTFLKKDPSLTYTESNFTVTFN